MYAYAISNRSLSLPIHLIDTNMLEFRTNLDFAPVFLEIESPVHHAKITQPQKLYVPRVASFEWLAKYMSVKAR